MKSVLIIGQHGQVSHYLQQRLAADYTLIVLSRDELDLTNLEQIQAVLDAHQPDIIINPAAYTAVDLAEQEEAQAMLINCHAVERIAQYAKQTNTPLIHYSTDYVFSGDASVAYKEDDIVSPSSVYGRTKYLGEQAVLNSGAPALILRTSWVYGNHGKNFYRTMLNLAQTRDELSVVADQYGGPTYAGSIADVTKQLLDIIVQQDGLDAKNVGVYHFTCAGQTSWCDFAKAIFTEHELSVKVNSITTEQYPTPAKRPAFSVLDNQKLKQVFKLSLPTWQQGLQQCISDAQNA